MGDFPTLLILIIVIVALGIVTSVWLAIIGHVGDRRRAENAVQDAPTAPPKRVGLHEQPTHPAPDPPARIPPPAPASTPSGTDTAGEATTAVSVTPPADPPQPARRSLVPTGLGARRRPPGGSGLIRPSRISHHMPARADAPIPDAFLSYARADNDYPAGKITELRELLEKEVKIQTGRREFRIFQDDHAIVGGTKWKEKIDDILDEVTIFIPVLSPSFFSSDLCRHELRRFLDRENESGDLKVLPIYWVKANEMKTPTCPGREDDELVRRIRSYHYTDLREIRSGELDTPESRALITRMAIVVQGALDGTAAR